MLISKINFHKKNYLYIFLNKKYFKNQPSSFQAISNLYQAILSTRFSTYELKHSAFDTT